MITYRKSTPGTATMIFSMAIGIALLLSVLGALLVSFAVNNPDAVLYKTFSDKGRLSIRVPVETEIRQDEALFCGLDDGDDCATYRMTASAEWLRTGVEQFDREAYTVYIDIYRSSRLAFQMPCHTEEQTRQIMQNSILGVKNEADPTEPLCLEAALKDHGRVLLSGDNETRQVITKPSTRTTADGNTLHIFHLGYDETELSNVLVVAGSGDYVYTVTLRAFLIHDNEFRDDHGLEKMAEIFESLEIRK